jgi:cytoskeleton protein RodZ
MPDSVQQHSSNNTTKQSLGEILRKARESMELSQQDVASQLNLQTNVIQALESDDIDNLPTITYVRGYIRNYAKIVNLNGNALIELYDDDGQAPPEILPDVKHSTQASSSDKPVRAVTYLITFGLVLLLFAWWQSHFIVGKNIFAGTEKASKQTNYGGYLSYTYDIVIHPDTPFLDNRLDGEAETTDPLNHMSLPLIDPTIDQIDKQLSIAIKETGTGKDNLILTINEKSWVEVYDANNNEIYMDIAKSGNVLNLNGAAPFSVILGFAPGVEVIFNGKPFRTESYSTGGVARFKLGE